MNKETKYWKLEDAIEDAKSRLCVDDKWEFRGLGCGTFTHLIISAKHSGIIQTYNILNDMQQSQNSRYDIDELKDFFLHLTISKYDSWYSRYSSFEIIEVQLLSDDKVNLIGVGKGNCYIFSVEEIESLIGFGMVERHREIDHCDVYTKYSLHI